MMRVCGASACLLSAGACVAFAGAFGNPQHPELWGASRTAWASRLLVGLALLTRTLRAPDRFRVSRSVAAVVVLVLGLSNSLAPQTPGSLFYMPQLSGVTVICFGLALAFLESRLELALRLVPWLGISGIALNSVTLLGYLYNARPLYGGSNGTVGVLSAVTSLLLGIALVLGAGTERAPLRLVIGQSISARLLRTLLPVTCGAMLLGEVLSDVARGVQRGDPALQDAVQTLLITVFITGVVLLVTKRTGERLEETERERDRARAELADLNKSLGETVALRTAELENLNRELRVEIQQRTDVERALRQTEAKSAALLSALPDWIFRVRCDGTIVDARAPRDENADAAQTQRLLESKVSEYVRANPRVRPHSTVDFAAGDATFEARFVPAGAADVLAVVRDISELSRLEREVLEANVREQRRIGEELHDGLGQQLTAVAFLSKLLELDLRDKGLTQANEAAEIQRQISASISTIRSLARGLFRYELGAGSLCDALSDLASAADAHFRVQCTVEAEPNIALADPTADLHLYRISQEAITNAVRHGQAKRIRIVLKREGSQVVFRVEDDGTGTPPAFEKKGPAGIGLRTMEFRTRRLGGRFAIESKPGRGTAITCILPAASATPECQNLEQKNAS